MANTDLHFVAGALQPVHRGIRFLGGGVDDGVQVDAAAAAIVDGNHTVGTFFARIMVPDITGTYSFMGFGDANAVEYVHFTVEAGTIWVMMVKATPVTQLDVNTPAGTIKAHKWYNVFIRQNADIMEIWVGEDGKQLVNQTLTWTTATDTAQWFDDLNNIDTATIGAADSVAGGALLTNEFKGYISDVAIWSGTVAACALSEQEMNRVASGEITTIQATYLHNYWSLNQTLTDAGTGADDGTAVGDIIYSDANEFASRLTFLETVPLVADNVTILGDGGVGYAYSILGA